MTAPIYAARGISKRFGPNWALSEVDLDVREGEIVGMVGSNGAGKSTLLKILAGSLLPDRGELLLEGKPIRMSSMLDAWRNGIALVSQELNLFPALTIAENLALIPGRTGFLAKADFRMAAEATLARLGLTAPLSSRLGMFSLADQQLVEIARALLQKPRVLILDEPTSALGAAEGDRLHAVLHGLRDAGVAIVYISHFLEEVLEVSDSIAVLRDGRRVLPMGGSTRPSLNAIVAAMLGEHPAEKQFGGRPAEAGGARATAKASLRIRHLEGPVGLSIDALDVAAGEVVGVAGLAGAGVEELFAILFGRLKPVGGTIELPSGRPYVSETAAAVASGVAYFPADRKRLGLMLAQTVRENVSSVRDLTLGLNGFFISRRRQTESAKSRCGLLGIKMVSVEQAVGSLSGGNQQKVVFAKWMEAAPSLLLLDDPMRGVDIGAKKEMYGIIRALSGEGRLILFYSSDAADYVAVADRVLVFGNGSIREEISAARLSEHSLVASINAGVAA